MRLIDLDNPKVRHLLCNLDRKAVPGRELNNEGWLEELGGFIEELLKISEEEPVDAVPVVRCKECEYWSESFCTMSALNTHALFYCAIAERKTESE